MVYGSGMRVCVMGRNARCVCEREEREGGERERERGERRGERAVRANVKAISAIVVKL